MSRQPRAACSLTCASLLSNDFLTKIIKSHTGSGVIDVLSIESIDKRSQTDSETLTAIICPQTALKSYHEKTEIRL